MGKIKKWRVEVDVTLTCSKFISATTMEAAITKAENLDACDWINADVMAECIGDMQAEQADE